jgi:hypothetical protein
LKNSAKIFRPTPELRDRFLDLIAEKKDPATCQECPRVTLEEGIGPRARAVIALPQGIEVRIIFNDASIPMEPTHADVCRYEFVGRKPSVDAEREAFLADIEAGRVTKLWDTTLLWLFDITRSDLDALRRHGLITTWLDPYRSGRRFVFAADIVKMNDTIAALRAAQKIGGDAL